MAGDPYHLERFLQAQESTFSVARAELAAGQKRSHWMWFIFPQIRGLGSSSMAQRFALSGLKEAAAYLEHPTLGCRLEDCTALVNATEGHSVDEIFGYPDDLKFHSSMTLFAKATEEFHFETSVFAEALEKHFSGRLDPGTLQQLEKAE